MGRKQHICIESAQKCNRLSRLPPTLHWCVFLTWLKVQQVTSYAGVAIL